MYQLIVSFTVNKGVVWQIPLDISSEHAKRLDEKGYLAVGNAAKTEFIKQVKGDQYAKSNKKPQKQK